MDAHYDQTLLCMEETHGALAARVAQPRTVAVGDRYAFRYHERDVHQAIVQKLARVVSGLHAARLLLANGFVQELGALQRMLDEFNEDILFLEDLWNYFYRSIGSFVLAAKAFGDDVLYESVLSYMRNFAQANGEAYGHPTSRSQ